MAQVTLTSPVAELQFGDSTQLAVTVTAADGSTLPARAPLRTLRFRVTGSASVENTAAGSYARVDWAGNFPGDEPDAESFSTTFDVPVKKNIQLGRWEQPTDDVYAFARASDGPSTVSAESTFTLVEVVDSNGIVVPIAQVCSASGTTY